MNSTIKSMILSTILIGGTTVVMADPTEDSNTAMSHQQTPQRSINSESDARMLGATQEIQARERAQQAESHRASEPNGRETQAREQARLQMQNARSMGQQMENRGRTMMSRPNMTQRPSRPNMR